MMAGLVIAALLLWSQLSGSSATPYVERVAPTAAARAELVSTAYHEAAHFVVLHALAPQAVVGVTIVPSERYQGAVFHAELSPEQVDVAGVLLYAGFWGEVLSGVAQAKARVGALKDLEKAAPLLEQFVEADRKPGPISTVRAGASPLDRARGHYQAQAFVRVSMMWGAVEGVANALLELGTLDRDAAVRAFEAGKSAPADEVRNRLLEGWRRSQEGDPEYARRRRAAVASE